MWFFIIGMVVVIAAISFGIGVPLLGKHLDFSREEAEKWLKGLELFESLEYSFKIDVLKFYNYFYWSGVVGLILLTIVILVCIGGITWFLWQVLKFMWGVIMLVPDAVSKVAP